MAKKRKAKKAPLTKQPVTDPLREMPILDLPRHINYLARKYQDCVGASSKEQRLVLYTRRYYDALRVLGERLAATYPTLGLMKNAQLTAVVKASQPDWRIAQLTLLYRRHMAELGLAEKKPHRPKGGNAVPCLQTTDADRWRTKGE